MCAIEYILLNQFIFLLNICSYCGVSLYYIAGVFMGDAGGDISISG
jgi:hypothetical protein